jgi:hypothetical protein
MMDQKGYRIGNVDSLIMIEKPKMAPYISQMRENFARTLNCSTDRISVKATRGEGLGFVGREEGVLAQACVLLEGKIMLKETPEEKVLRDPVHGYIHVNLQVVWDIINSAWFQRLRRIKQLGGAYMVYHGA